MFGFRKARPLSPQAAYQAKLREVRDAQRAGDIQRAAELSEEAEVLLRRLEAEDPSRTAGLYPTG
jgi:hypothetical protein